MRSPVFKARRVCVCVCVSSWIFNFVHVVTCGISDKFREERRGERERHTRREEKRREKEN